MTMTGSTVTNIADETSSFGGIGVQIGDSTLSGADQVGFATLQNDTINNYQADGIFIDGANGCTPSSATISELTVTGIGPTPYDNARHYATYITGAVGIQITAEPWQRSKTARLLEITITTAIANGYNDSVRHPDYRRLLDNQLDRAE